MTIRVPADTWDYNWICRIFGHRIKGYGRSTPYGEATRGVVDGTGREHCSVWQKCDRCGVRKEIVKFHLPKGWSTDRPSWDVAKPSRAESASISPPTFRPDEEKVARMLCARYATDPDKKVNGRPGWHRHIFDAQVILRFAPGLAEEKDTSNAS